MKRYEKIGSPMISPLIMQGNAFDIARVNYAKYSRLNFWNDLMEYMRTGYVVCCPTVFAMFKPIDRDGKRGWFVQMAVGNILDLLRFVPCELDFIAFCRNNDDNMRVIEWKTFLKKVVAIKGLKINV